MGPRVLTARLKSVGALGLLAAALPFNAALTGVALARLAGRRLVRRSRTPSTEGSQKRQTILVSGGKMTKALQLARSFHAAGHRVVLVESAGYRLTGHRFSNAVAAFHTVPPSDSDTYAARLLEIVLAEQVDVYVPVCSPLASRYDARAEAVLSPHCRVLHAGPELVDQLDDKFAFAELTRRLGLPTPESYLIEKPAQVLDFDFEAHPGPFVLKNIGYDPLHRLDLTLLPRPTREETAAFVEDLPISVDRPWVMQAFVRGQEYCTHATAVDGQVQVYGCCESSAFQVNYAMINKPEIESWVRRFVAALNLTGQVSFDFIEDEHGQPLAIECNPRTHSAITMFHDQPALPGGYLESGTATVYPRPDSRPTFWTYHELWRLLRHPRTVRTRLHVLSEGTDAIFDWSDPLPFLLVHHLQIPWLLLRHLRRGQDWIRIDFNIGKLVEAGGD